MSDYSNFDDMIVLKTVISMFSAIDWTMYCVMFIDWS